MLTGKFGNYSLCVVINPDWHYNSKIWQRNMYPSQKKLISYPKLWQLLKNFHKNASCASGTSVNSYPFSKTRSGIQNNSSHKFVGLFSQGLVNPDFLPLAVSTPLGFCNWICVKLRSVATFFELIWRLLLDFPLLTLYWKIDDLLAFSQLSVWVVSLLMMTW